MEMPGEDVNAASADSIDVQGTDSPHDAVSGQIKLLPQGFIKRLSVHGPWDLWGGQVLGVCTGEHCNSTDTPL